MIYGRVMVAGLLMMGAAARAGEVEVVRSFAGNQGPGWKQGADLSGAVGPRHVAVLDEGGYMLQQKGTGTVIQKMTAREFWNQVDAGKGAEKGTGFDPQKECNDPRILYDALSERWFACEAGTGPTTKVYLAVSKSSNPTEGWKGVVVPVPPKDPGVKIGVDKNGVYITAYNGEKDFQQGCNVYAIPKADAVAAGGPDVSHMTVLEKLQYPLCPAVDLDGNKAADAPFAMLNFDGYTGTSTDTLYMYKITWKEGKASVSEKQKVKLSKQYLTPNGASHLMDCSQPGTEQKLRADSSRRTESLMAFKGSVFGANGTKVVKEGRPGILWYEVRVSDGKVMQEGFVDDAKRDYLFPALAVDGKGNVGIGATGTSETEFPSVYVMMHGAGDAAGTMRAAVCAMKGTTYYRYAGVPAVNWCNYSTTCVDPSDAEVLWTFQGYAGSEVDKQWCSAWAAFKLK